MRKLFLSLLLFLFVLTFTFSQNDFEGQLRNIHNVHKIELLKSYDDKSEFLIYFKQPLNHNNSADGYFYQRLWVTFVSPDLPTVVVTEGYMANSNYKTELLNYFDANQIIIEHRFFGESVPNDSIPWKYLTVEQSANDHEAVINEFKNVFKSKWITTGISKGGQMAFIHRALFPNSVDLTITYVAPYNLERDDVRLIDFFNDIDENNQQETVFNFQKELLLRKERLLPFFENYSNLNNLQYFLTNEEVYELSVLELKFSACQWGILLQNGVLKMINDSVLFDEFSKKMDFRYFTVDSYKEFSPFFYQAYTELGYYGYETGELKKHLNCFDVDTVSSDFFLKPFEFDVKFDNTYIYYVLEEFKKHNPATIHIVGAKDPWSATSPNVEGLSNSLKVIDKKGTHFQRIENLPETVKIDVLSFIEKILEQKINY